MAHVPHVPADTPPEKISAELRDNGAVIVENFLDDDTLTRFNTELDPQLDGVSPRRDFVNPAVAYFFGDKTRHVSGMAARSRVFGEEILPHPTYMGICDEVLGPFCASYSLNIAHVLDRGPGAEQQMFHRDELVWAHLPKPHPEIQIASIIALVDFTADIGATRLVPGSHEWPAERQPEPDEIAVAEMPAGAAVLYLGSTLHGGGPNITTDRWRRGMHVSYAVGWLRTEENQCLSVPPDIARTLPRRSQELLGYDVHDALLSGGGYLGTVDLVTPADLLSDGKL